MKRISYNIFPWPLLILGYAFILMAAAPVFVEMGWFELEMQDSIISSLTLFIIGIIITTFRTKITVPEVNGYILKEATILGFSFSQERIKIPGRSSRILICTKIKKGTGYYRYVLPVTYFFKSADMVFCGELGMTKILNTDYSRAIKIAEFLKENLKIDYRVESE